MSKIHVFISYSKKDTQYKERLVTQLKVLEDTCHLDIWDDSRIETGDNWRPEIFEAIDKADIAILMISADFLTTKFIKDDEIPRILNKRKENGMWVIPLIVRECAWKKITWLSEIQGRPKEDKVLELLPPGEIEQQLSFLTIEIHNKITEPPNQVITNSTQSTSIEIPYVIVSMNKNEAKKLEDLSIFTNSNEKQTFVKFKNFLETIHMHWVENYYDSRDNWKPHTEPDTDINELIKRQFNTAIQYNDEIFLLSTISLSEEALDEDPTLRHQAWETIRNFGGIVIVDTVTLFHPILRRYLRDSETLSIPYVSFLFISPVNVSENDVNIMINQLMENELNPSSYRFRIIMDKMCEFGAGNELEINRWIIATRPEVATRILNQKQILSINELSSILGNPPRFHKVYFYE